MTAPNVQLHQPSYRIFEMDLTNIRGGSGEQILGTGELYESLIPMNIPAALGCRVKLGNNGQEILLDEIPPLSICPAGATGIYFLNSVAAPGTVCRFMVGMSDGPQGN